MNIKDRFNNNESTIDIPFKLKNKQHLPFMDILLN